MQKKRTFLQERLTQVCSQIVCVCVFLVSFWGFFKFACFAENTIKLGFQQKHPPKKQNMSC